VATANPTRTSRRESAPAGDCHPAYGGCLPIVEDLDCPEINNQQVEVFDPSNDPYGLDVARGAGNGITCDGEA
jgi:hypothetical protein